MLNIPQLVKKRQISDYRKDIITRAKSYLLPDVDKSIAHKARLPANGMRRLGVEGDGSICSAIHWI